VDEVRILIDRDLTLSLTGPHGLVAQFEESFPLYRAFDGTELAIVHEMGRFEGGMFSTAEERRWGASWASSSLEDVAEWAGRWVKSKRLGKALFVAVADAQGQMFFREGGRREVDFDPDGPAVQPSLMPLSLCNTGLGCSVVVSTDDVTFFRVERGGSVEEMSAGEVDEYVARHPLPEVSLRSFGFGTPWYSGTISGKSVIVGQDTEDKLWIVRNRADDPFVVGAKSKKAAVTEAKRMIAAGRYEGHVSRLNRVPDGFDEVALGDTFRNRSRWTGKVQVIGSNYVTLRGRRPYDDYDDHLTVTAAKLMRSWMWVD
jgi:hypothetical protein